MIAGAWLTSLKLQIIDKTNYVLWNKKNYIQLPESDLYHGNKVYPNPV